MINNAINNILGELKCKKMFYLPKRIFNDTIEDIIVYLYRNYTIKGEFEMQNKDKKKVTSKQVVAMTGVILLVLLYVVTLIVSIVDKSASGQWFMICLMATVAIPILIWIYTWMYGKLTGKKTIADVNANFGPSDVADTEEETN